MPAFADRCLWCGEGVPPDDGFRLLEPAGARGGAFCRLEHVVPWAIQGARWEAVEAGLPPGLPVPETCSECDGALPDTRLVLLRHRGEHRIPDAFCRVDHLLAWAKAGGRWR